MANFVLVHGAYHAAWCWQRVVPVLEQAGHRVSAPDLPGHGDDKAPPADVTMSSYAGRVA
ncbi:MAG: alpha/beta fold hydrolase, partial [Rhodospirillaceae bacterium]|nr:alpha/beta fold hydrolase [Rhodospirillaceae bacterium]